MAASDLRERVTFQKRAISDDGYGNSQGEFGDQFTEAAAIAPRLGGEQVLAGRLAGRSLMNVTVRQSARTSSVTTDWRAVDARTGETYNIRSIVDPHKSTAKHGRYWEMLVESGVAT